MAAGTRDTHSAQTPGSAVKQEEVQEVTESTTCMFMRMLKASLALGAVSLLQEEGCTFHHEKALAQAGKQTTEVK